MHACVWNFKRTPLWIQFIIFSVLEKKTCSTWTSTLSSAHVMTGVHPQTKHLQTCGTLNQIHNLQIHSWLALSLFVFFIPLLKKYFLRSRAAATQPIHILAPRLIEIRAKQQKTTVLSVKTSEIWNNIPSYNKSMHYRQRI